MLNAIDADPQVSSPSTERDSNSGICGKKWSSRDINVDKGLPESDHGSNVNVKLSKKM